MSRVYIHPQFSISLDGLSPVKAGSNAPGRWRWKRLHE